MNRILDSKKTSATSAGDIPARISTPRKVLIVEDIALIRMTTTDMVEEIGYSTAEADSGEAALEVLKRDPEILVLLTDLGLPGMSGQQLIAEVLKIRPDMQIVVATGMEGENGAIPPRAVKLMKPFDIEQLRKALGS